MFQRVKCNFQESLYVVCLSIRSSDFPSTFGKTAFVLDDGLPQIIKHIRYFIIHDRHFKVLRATETRAQESCLFWKSTQTAQGMISRLLLNILGMVRLWA